MDNWSIFACQHQALWPVATLVKVQRPRVNCSLALSLSTLPHPALSNPIIHPREQLDWGEADDRWTVSPDCADLIEKGCSRLIRKQDLWKRLQQSQVAGSREISSLESGSQLSRSLSSKRRLRHYLLTDY